jgi:hypothetical protein
MISISKIKCNHQFSGACSDCRQKAMGSDPFSAAASILLAQALPGVVTAVGQEISDSSDPHAFDEFKGVSDFFSPLSNLFKGSSGTSSPIAASNIPATKPKVTFVSNIPTKKSFLEQYKYPIAITSIVLVTAALGFFIVRRK